MSLIFASDFEKWLNFFNIQPGGGGGGGVSQVFGTNNEITVNSTDPANPVVGIADNPILPGTAGFLPPRGTTAQRNPEPTPGETRYNTDLEASEYWNGTDWVSELSGTGNVISDGTGTTGQIPLYTTDGYHIGVSSITDFGSYVGIDNNLQLTGSISHPGSILSIQPGGDSTQFGGDALFNGLATRIGIDIDDNPYISFAGNTAINFYQTGAFNGVTADWDVLVFQGNTNGRYKGYTFYDGVDNSATFNMLMGFRGETAVPGYVTLDIPNTGTWFFWDNLEVAGFLFAPAEVLTQEIPGANVNVLLLQNSSATDSSSVSMEWEAYNSVTEQLVNRRVIFDGLYFNWPLAPFGGFKWFNDSNEQVFYITGSGQVTTKNNTLDDGAGSFSVVGNATYGDTHAYAFEITNDGSLNTLLNFNAGDYTLSASASSSGLKTSNAFIVNDSGNSYPVAFGVYDTTLSYYGFICDTSSDINISNFKFNFNNTIAYDYKALFQGIALDGSGASDSEGVVMVLTHNSSGNRQFGITSSENLAAPPDSSHPIARWVIGSSGIDFSVVSTDGLVNLPLVFQADYGVSQFFGNVSIGNDLPEYKLDIQNSNAALRLGDNSGIPDTPSDGVVFFSNFDAGLGHSIAFYKDSAGNVTQIGAGSGGGGTVTEVDVTNALTVDGIVSGSFTVSGTIGINPDWMTFDSVDNIATFGGASAGTNNQFTYGNGAAFHGFGVAPRDKLHVAGAMRYNNIITEDPPENYTNTDIIQTQGYLITVNASTQTLFRVALDAFGSSTVVKIVADIVGISVGTNAGLYTAAGSDTVGFHLPDGSAPTIIGSSDPKDFPLQKDGGISSVTAQWELILDGGVWYAAITITGSSADPIKWNARVVLITANSDTI